MRTLILCGGKGTRAYPMTLEVPKPLLEVGGRPVLAHVMEIYARQGFTDFVLAAGFQVELIEAFAEQPARRVHGGGARHRGRHQHGRPGGPVRSRHG